jgi:hypothetical protein
VLETYFTFFPSQHFKWQVKETPLLARPGTSAHSQSHDQAQQIREQYQEDEEQKYSNEGGQEDDVFEGQDDHPALQSQSSILEEEMPAPSTTRNLLAKFQSLSESTENLQSHDLSYRQSRSSSRDNLDFYQEREQPEGGEINHAMSSSSEFLDEDAPRDPNVTRESDRHDEEELPEQGTTRNLLAKFQSMQMAH